MFGFGGQKAPAAKSVCKVAYKSWSLDRELGESRLSLTGIFSSKSNTYGLEATYKIDENFSVYGAVDLSDTSVHNVGMTGKLEFGDQRVLLDASYILNKDAIRAKIAAPIDDLTLTGYLLLTDVGKDAQNHKEAIEASLKLSNEDQAGLFYDFAARSVSGRYTRLLDSKNAVRLQYTFESQDKHSGAVKLTHKADLRNRFEIEADLGSNTYSLAWKQETDNGLWAVTTSIPFDSHPKHGDLTIKRRFDMTV
mmetsp:Transcript_4324/g.11841  ORF Transcript_4324/g.11841 Transcript_4324/m.11841 type:complete len:251 (-) Transcript_4324:278-1030(-)